MKEVKCKNCGASFRPADKFCSYCGSSRPGNEDKTPHDNKEEKKETKTIADEFKNMGLNSSVLNNLFGSIFDD